MVSDCYHSGCPDGGFAQRNTPLSIGTDAPKCTRILHSPASCQYKTILCRSPQSSLCLHGFHALTRG
nr:MAG TPA: hypothetical protein [Caudoviricetes sp.]